MKGVILAGGSGSRLYPLTKITNKHLLPVYNQPMIMYPIQAFVNAGITDIMLVTGGNHAGEFLRLLGNGEQFGINRLQYAYQEGVGGIPEALALAENFIDDSPFAVMLGDNIFSDISQSVLSYDGFGARVVLCEILDSEHLQDLGVAKLNEFNQIQDIIEKPSDPPSDFAVTGLYFYDYQVWDILPDLKRSARGELEITDINNYYIEIGEMDYSIVDNWADAGSSIDGYFDTALRVRNAEF